MKASAIIVVFMLGALLSCTKEDATDASQAVQASAVEAVPAKK